MYSYCPGKKEFLYRYCKSEGLDYEYVLNECQIEKKKIGFYPKRLFKKYFKFVRPVF